MQRSGARLRAGLVLAAMLASACGGGFSRQYEYDEEIYLGTGGDASIVVNTSIAALVALRGAPLDPASTATVNRDVIRQLFESPGTRVTRITRPWRRNGRRFIGIRIDVDDVHQLSAAPAFAWSSYALRSGDGQVTYRQVVGPPSSLPAGSPSGLSGDEIVAFRLHLPSRVLDHNARSLDTKMPLDLERGNILSWEQRLRDRLQGKPVTIEVRMEAQSILYRTLWLFAFAFGAAMLVLVGVVWWVRRRGAADEAAA